MHAVKLFLKKNMLFINDQTFILGSQVITAEYIVLTIIWTNLI